MPKRILQGVVVSDKNDKTIVVTGGSSGLGRAMALAFARRGAHVVVADVRRDPRAGGTPTDELIVSEGGSGAYVETDVSRTFAAAFE